jgi:hypothetical protein
MFWLAQHVYVCRSGTNVVLLDLKRDKYIGITGDVMDALGGTLAGWPAATKASCSASTRSSDLLQKMRACGMVTSDAHSGKPAEPVSMPRAESALIEGYRKPRVNITARDVMRFTASCLSARIQARWFPVEQLVSRSRARLSRQESFDMAKAREHVQIFRRLRPLLYTGHDACLLDSFTLRLFLARYGLAPRWVFGVRMTPFGAHCWLQQDTVVINDAPEHVRGFTPIMVV